MSKNVKKLDSLTEELKRVDAKIIEVDEQLEKIELQIKSFKKNLKELPKSKLIVKKKEKVPKVSVPKKRKRKSSSEEEEVEKMDKKDLVLPRSRRTKKPTTIQLDNAVTILEPRDAKEVEEIRKNRVEKRNSLFRVRDNVLEYGDFILMELMSSSYAWPFLFPVDPDALHIPEYRDIIKNPMDLTTVKTKYDGGEYNSLDEFIADLMLVWDNAMEFNHQGSEIYTHAENLKTKLLEMTKKLEILGISHKEEKMEILNEKLNTLKKEHEKVVEELNTLLETKKGIEEREKHLPIISKSTLKRKLKYEEKKEIYDKWEKLDPKYAIGIGLILSKSKLITRLKPEDLSVKIEIDVLEPHILHRLLKFLRDCENGNTGNGKAEVNNGDEDNMDVDQTEEKPEQLLVFERPVTELAPTEIVEEEESSSTSSSDMSVDSSSSESEESGE